MPDIQSVLHQYGVAGEVRPGWMNLGCPFCKGTHHLGVNLEGVWFTCWRCGWHDPVATIAALCHIGKADALELYRSIAPGRAGASARDRNRAVQARISLNPYKRPSDVAPLTRSHKTYLAGRGFDPDRLASEWGLMSTGPTSHLDRIDYRYRVFIPIEWDGREVSFLARDATGRSEIKYRSCPQPREAVHHKHIFYGHPNCFKRRIGIAVEGATDCWRLGDAAFALFGIRYKREQVNEIVRHFDRVTVVFDGDREAQRQAAALEAELGARGVRAGRVRLGPGQDPGVMSEDDASHLVREAVGADFST